MTTQQPTLSEADRDVWKEMYRLHERYQHMQNEDLDWQRLYRDVENLFAKKGWGGNLLAECLTVALFDFFSETFRKEWKEQQEAPRQVSMFPEAM